MEDSDSVQSSNSLVSRPPSTNAEDMSQAGNYDVPFTPAEDIAILIGILQYIDKKKACPNLANWATRFDFLKNWLHIDCALHEPLEVYHRTEALREKYFASLRFENGKPGVSSPIDGRVTFRLSHMVWGCGTENFASSSGYMATEETMKISGGGDVEVSAGPSTLKRPNEVVDQGYDPETKKIKMARKDLGDIEILKAMHGYFTEKKAYPIQSLDRLLDFIKNWLPPNPVDPFVIHNRIIDLLSNYMNSVKNKDGKPESSSDDHEFFFWSKKTWGFDILHVGDLIGSTTGEGKNSSEGGDQQDADMEQDDGTPES